MTSPGLQASFFPVLVLAIASSVVLMEGLARQGKGFISLSSYSDVLRSGSNLCYCRMQWLIITIWCKFLIRLGGCRTDTEFGTTSVRFLFSCYSCNVRVNFPFHQLK